MTRARRWVLLGTEASLRAALDHHAPSDPGALAAGRVFVDGRRVRDGGIPVAAGCVLEIVEARAVARVVHRVLSNWDGVLVVEKPAGVPTEPDRSGTGDSVVEAIARQLGLAVAELHAASRLDLGVSGVVLLAATNDARRRLEDWRRRGCIRRRYVALARGVASKRDGTWDAPVGRDARPATTHYRAVAEVRRVESLSLLALQPKTGRFHQLRVHCAQAQLPLLGDPGNGGPRRIVGPDGAVVALSRIGLHALWVELVTANGTQRVSAPVPDELRMWWNRMGGDSEAWNRAAEVDVS